MGYQMKGWSGFSPLKQNDDEKDKAMQTLKTYSPSVIVDNPNPEVYKPHTEELETKIYHAQKILKKHGLSEEELDDATGRSGWDAYVDYHGLNIM